MDHAVTILYLSLAELIRRKDPISEIWEIRSTKPKSHIFCLPFSHFIMSFLPNLARTARRSNRLQLPRTQMIRQRLASSSTPAVKFTSPTTEHVSHLRTLLSSKSSLLSTLDESASNEELDGFNVDWMGKYKGQSRVVVKPKNTQEVADVMKYCYEQGIAIVPQGGNTGLVGMFTFLKDLQYRYLRRPLSHSH